MPSRVVNGTEERRAAQCRVVNRIVPNDSDLLLAIQLHAFLLNKNRSQPAARRIDLENTMGEKIVIRVVF